MRDSEEVVIEDSKVHAEGTDDTGAVVMLTAANVCLLKHAWEGIIDKLRQTRVIWLQDRIKI